MEVTQVDDELDVLMEHELVGVAGAPAVVWAQLLQLMMLLTVVAACCECQPAERVSRRRLEWDPHLAYLLEESRGSFDRYYRMSLDAFLFLRALLLPFLQKDHVMAFVCCGQAPIDATIIMHCTLRWLAGANYDDLRVIGGVSKSSFYRAVHACLAAICKCPDLAYRFPSTQHEVNDAAASFAHMSSHRVVRGCVGAMDGLLLKIKAPARWETGHVRSFFE
eukprot:GHVU01088453.1.p1 GENE.GHVU01088453.1~~GHVU01088453.1.p1  ORF type:complete len:221 (+),score=23.12 GHVU01088453.1:357-1019(+)